ncbi:PIF1-like helicase-domain-containing protein [Pilobolus umbonatus]|nr:PIF1-like helicase-domain-containing protein [Pilobolus umbonatus]
MSMHNTEIPSGWFIDIHIPSQLKVKRTPPVNKSVDTENKSVDTENKSVETIDGTVLVNNDVQMTKNVNNGVNTPVSGPGRKISISIKEKPPPMKEPTHRGITLSKETQLRGVSVNKSLGVQAPAVSRKRPSGVCVASSELNVKPTKRLNTTGSVSAPVAPKPVEVSLESLSSDQRRIYNKIVYEKKNIFFTGSAGTGKSILLKVIIRQLQTTIGNKLAVTASTGIAALNINGTTLHSFANIKLGEESVETYVGQILKNKRSYESWERTETLIIDEGKQKVEHTFYFSHSLFKSVHDRRSLIG